MVLVFFFIGFDMGATTMTTSATVNNNPLLDAWNDLTDKHADATAKTAAAKAAQAEADQAKATLSTALEAHIATIRKAFEV